jgi:hypothetical protein
MRSHDELIKKAGLVDVKLKDRDFVRIEILPNDETYKNLTRNKKDWFFKVDEPNTLPDWFENNKAECEALCWTAWEKSVKVNIALNYEAVVIKDNQFVYACGNPALKRVVIPALKRMIIPALKRMIIPALKRMIIPAL